MALITINHHTNTLGKHHSFKVILPEEDSQYDTKSEVQPLKSILLLHGLSNDETVYTRYTNIERFANAAHIAVIMPSADHSFYTNMVFGHSYYDYVLEVHDYARQILPLSKKREDNFVAGHSMGGYGTIKMAFTQGDRFAKACFMSSATHLENLLSYEWYDFSPKAIAGDVTSMKELDIEPRALVDRALADGYALPELYMMCGTEDELYQNNLDFKKYLEDHAVDFKYEDGPGGHDWEYWNEGIHKAIQWFAGNRR
ncbi:alpha/beta hydrolase [Salinicoccus sp. HZC-1]|uniref:alpha/beta hydrolase n=1 Tax=Salinicoccus sp. HZC-1 TaxID=3385497 RepID=UPI00398A9D5F